MAIRIIAVANQKGGVGKTTTSVNLSAYLAFLGHRVLLIDLDPQGNATQGSGVNKVEVERSINEVLLGESEIREAIIKNTPAGYDLLAANSRLTAAEVALTQIEAGQLSLKKSLSKISRSYDFVLIDCPPSLNMLTINALAGAHSILITMQCEYFALEGLSALLGTMEQIKLNLNPKLEIEGLLRTMFDTRNRLAKDVSKQLQSHFGNKLFKAKIPRNVRLAECPSYGIPINQYDKKSEGAKAYLALAKEICKKKKSAAASKNASKASTLWQSLKKKVRAKT